MSYGTVAQLRVVELDGPISRELIVRESTTMYNLHRAVQFCIKPKQADDTVSSKVSRSGPIGVCSHVCTKSLHKNSAAKLQSW